MKQKKLIRLRLYSICIGLLIGLAYFVSNSLESVFAQASEIRWSTPENISNSPDLTSTDPFLLADPAGFAHLFWAEKVSNVPGEQTDTLMYTRWDGKEWLKPIDIFFAPPEEITAVIVYPHAVIDDSGTIHLIWMGEPNAPAYTLFYSSVKSSQAGSAQAWRERTLLADELTGSKYSIHIAYSPPNTLHVAYARVPAGYAPSRERAVTYIRSTDGGLNWTEPLDIYIVPYLDWGASDVRLLAEPPNKLYASWTVWDKSGNGKYVYFARALDNGLTWDEPIILAERVDPEYERDWNNMALLGPGQIVAVWEGGYRAYRYAMYSYDSGATWSQPIDIFPYLIGDNGLVEFARDSTDRLHIFIAQRIREGYEDIRGQHMGLWHSIWEGGPLWREPVLVTSDEAAAKNMTNPKIVVVGGNRIVAAWYGSGVNEIIVQTGLIDSSPPIFPTPWKPLFPELPPTPAMAESIPIETSTIQPNSTELDQNASTPTNNGIMILLGVMPALIIVISLVTFQYYRLQKKPGLDL